MLAVERACDVAPYGTQIRELQDGGLVLGQILLTQELQFPRADPPSHEQLTQSDEEQDVHEVLDREGIREVRRGIVEEQNREPLDVEAMCGWWTGLSGCGRLRARGARLSRRFRMAPACAGGGEEHRCHDDEHERGADSQGHHHSAVGQLEEPRARGWIAE